MAEIDTPENDLALINPEDLRMTEAEVLGDAERMVKAVVIAIPNGMSPAQSRILIKNTQDVYSSCAGLIKVMLSEKKAVLH
jgi:hypothetical protein